MKTTTLYKFPGAWSPLSMLSDETKFEIKSLNYEANMFVGLDTGYCCIMTPPAVFDLHAVMHEDVETFQDYLSEQFADAIISDKINQRAAEIFGDKCSPVRDLFAEKIKEGRAILVRFSGGDGEMLMLS